MKSYMRREKSRRSSKTMKMGEKWGEQYSGSGDKRLQRSYSRNIMGNEERSEKIQRQEKKIDRFRE